MSSTITPSVSGIIVNKNVQSVAAPSVVRSTWRPALARRRIFGAIFSIWTGLCTLLGILVVGYLLWTVTSDGIGSLTWDFINNFPSRFPQKAGIKAALWGSAYLAVYTALFSLPVGISAAIYLEEFAEDTRLRKIIDINISNLAGVPSIVYGMLGLAVFVRIMGLGRSIIAGSLTMGILILPIIIVTSREALRAVPMSIRHAAYALGATQWQTVRAHILPAATPGILTGIILSMARAAGETAPLILIGALSFVAFVPDGPMDSFTVLPIQVFNWISRPQEEFHAIAAAGIIALLVLLLITNALAVWIRYWNQRKYQW